MAEERKLDTPGVKDEKEKEKEKEKDELTTQFQEFHKKGPVQDNKEYIQTLAKLVANDNDEIGLNTLLFGACCSDFGFHELEFREVTIVENGKGRKGKYVKGRRFIEWCMNEQDKLPFDVTETNIRLFVFLLIKYGYMTKARIQNHEMKTLEPLPDGKPSSSQNLFNKEFYLWNYRRI
jgi:hypothetical protein